MWQSSCFRFSYRFFDNVFYRFFEFVDKFFCCFFRFFRRCFCFFRRFVREFYNFDHHEIWFSVTVKIIANFLIFSCRWRFHVRLLRCWKINFFLFFEWFFWIRCVLWFFSFSWIFCFVFERFSTLFFIDFLSRFRAIFDNFLRFVDSRTFCFRTKFSNFFFVVFRKFFKRNFTFLLVFQLI